MKQKLKTHLLWSFVLKVKITLLTVIWILFVGQSVVAQNHSISGNVKNTSGEPLPGVTIVIKGSTTGTITDSNGKFNVGNISPDATLIFSFIGMKTQEIPIAGKTDISVVLNEESVGLEEVVAIGYGTARKQDLSGAVGVVGGNELAQRKTTMVSQALQGAVPGVMVTRTGGAPGSTSTIRVRGITTIGDSDPLVIIDGVPGGINTINPNDIESISVLKDAASASIYGSRAAAGVILITTKRANDNSLSLNYNYEFGVEGATTFSDFVDVQTYMRMANEQVWNDAGNPAGGEYGLFPKEKIDNYYSLNAENPNLYPITDWADMILNKYAPRESHYLDVVAGSKAIKTKVSLGYDKNKALYDGYTFERLTARLNNDITINKNIKVAVDLHLKRSITERPYDNPMSRIRFSGPVFAAVWADGRIAEGKTGTNMYAAVKYGGFNNSWSNEVGGKISLDITPVKDLTISAIVSPNFSPVKGKSFRKAITYAGAEDPTAIVGYIEGHTSTLLRETRNDNYSVTSQLLANYSKKIGNHNFNLLLGYEDFYAFSESLSASRDQYELSAYPYLDLGSLAYRDNSGSAYENAYRSYFGRIMYNYQNRYLLQANIRYDGSSRFDKNYRWGSFPSFSAGWVLTEESFLKDNAIVPYAKLRLSWGTLGNERIGNYPYQSSIEFGNAFFYKGNNIVSAQSAFQSKYAIRDISWETTESINIGADLGLFNNKLRISGDYYIKTTKDMLLALEIPDYLGLDNPDQNTGKMETKGWEAEIGWNSNIGELKYSIGLNISDFKSVMGDLGGTEFLGAKIKTEGSEFDEWYGYISDGLFQTQEEVANSPKLSSSVKPGDIKYVDISGPDGVPDGIINSVYDRVLLGGSLPRYMFAGNVNLSYKNFDFSMVFQGVGKQNAHLNSDAVKPLEQNWSNAPKFLENNYFSTYNTAEQNLKVQYPRLSQSSSGNNYAMSDYWLFEGRYLRLKNLTVGYTLPDLKLSGLDIQSLRIYLSTTDLFSWDKYPKGWDPETNSLDSYPITRSLLVGLSVKF